MAVPIACTADCNISQCVKDMSDDIEAPAS